MHCEILDGGRKLRDIIEVDIGRLIYIKIYLPISATLKDSMRQDQALEAGFIQIGAPTFTFLQSQKLAAMTTPVWQVK
ncbi:hypothetical protein D3C77_385920 [compost metagenome]